MTSLDHISLDLNDLDDDLLESTNDFDVENNFFGIQLETKEESAICEPITLESILNEEDDLENDEILRSLGDSLTIIKKTSSEAELTEINQNNIGNIVEISNSFNVNQQNPNLSEKNGIVCKQSSLKQISAQLMVAIDRSDAGLPTTLAVAQLFVVGTSRGLVLLFDSQQILKLYITTENKDAITALTLNNKLENSYNFF